MTPQDRDSFLARSADAHAPRETPDVPCACCGGPVEDERAGWCDACVALEEASVRDAQIDAYEAA